jgi:hypothetical protein
MKTLANWPGFFIYYNRGNYNNWQLNTSTL